jgi:PKD repeat protein
MSRPRHPRAVLVALAIAIAVSAHPAGAQAAPDGHIVGSFQLSGVITKVVNVKGERRGQRIKRTWSFQPAACSSSLVCEQIVVTRARAGGRRDTATLTRAAPGIYKGTGSYPIAVRCGRKRLPSGGTGSFSLRVHIRAVQLIQNVPFATAIDATYRSIARVNQTKCPGFLGQDAASYQGPVAALPSPPTANFSYARQSQVPATFSFQDTSAPGTGGALIVARQWDFGDPASGAANNDTSATPSHSYAVAGTYTVTLTVIDANGLTSTTSRQVVS